MLLAHPVFAHPVLAHPVLAHPVLAHPVFAHPVLGRVVPGLTAWSVIIALVCGGMAVFFVVIAVSLREPRRPSAVDRSNAADRDATAESRARVTR